MRDPLKRAGPAVLLLAILTVAAAGAMEQPMLGEKAPGFDLPGVEGERVSLEGLRGKFVVIHFAASW